MDPTLMLNRSDGILPNILNDLQRMISLIMYIEIFILVVVGIIFLMNTWE